MKQSLYLRMLLRENLHLARLAWVVAGVVLAINWLLPPGYNASVFFLFPIFLGVYFKEKNDVLLLGVIVTTMAFMAIFFHTDKDQLQTRILAQLPLLAGIWIAFFLVVRFLDYRELEEGQEQKFEALFRFASSGMLVTNKHGVIVMANPAVERIFGYEVGELHFAKIEQLLPESMRSAHEGMREGYHNSPRPRTMGTGLDLRGRKKDGNTFPVEVSLSPFVSGKQQLVVAFVVDNTNRKNYENSILQQKQELTQLTRALGELNEQLEEKVEARTAELQAARDELSMALIKEKELGELKSRFVSMASHEFRTPLSAVLSSASLINSYLERGEFDRIQKHAERIKNAVNGLNTILTEFLSLGKLEEGRITASPAPMDLPECINDVHQELRTLFRTGQKLDYQHSGPELVKLDGSILRNILINLISNGIKYSSENATIWLTTAVEDHKMLLTIRDEGIGIPYEDQKHLFDRFFRASNATNIHGTGLGLYIVKRYVSMMNGSIRFESTPETGSTFFLEFELSDNE